MDEIVRGVAGDGVLARTLLQRWCGTEGLEWIMGCEETVNYSTRIVEAWEDTAQFGKPLFLPNTKAVDWC